MIIGFAEGKCSKYCGSVPLMILLLVHRTVCKLFFFFWQSVQITSGDGTLQEIVSAIGRRRRQWTQFSSAGKKLLWTLALTFVWHSIVMAIAAMIPSSSSSPAMAVRSSAISNWQYQLLTHC